MNQNIILLAVAEKRTWRTMGQLLRGSLYEVESLQSFPEYERLAHQKRVDLVVVDSDFIGKLTDEEASRIMSHANASGAKVLFINEGALCAKIPTLFRNHGLTNLVAVSPPGENSEMLVTVNKLLHKDVFGLEKYLPWGLRIVKRTIQNAARKSAVLAELERFAAHIECAPRLAQAFLVVADEMITNAIFDAPTDSHGHPRFRHLDRTTTVELDVGDEIVLAYACDGLRFAISVLDPFGSLSVNMLMGYLERWLQREGRQVSSSSGGAGLGFFFIFDYLTNFVVNIAPGKATEFIGFIDISGSYKDFAARPKSFNIFTGAPPERY